ncbi:MAG: PLDc_N domain-containing protein [Sporichthyaceae bacterium]|nr:PLDc_N domain-containing protein [Sporichthyaceae bacterium]
MLRALLIVLPIALAVYALVDLVQTDDERVQGLPKLAWVALIVLIWVIGPVAWLIAGKKGRRWFPGLAPRPATGPRPGGRSLAPDDDPDFLRGLRATPPPRPSPDEAPSADEEGDEPPPATR